MDDLYDFSTSGGEGNGDDTKTEELRVPESFSSPLQMSPARREHSLSLNCTRTDLTSSSLASYNVLANSHDKLEEKYGPDFIISHYNCACD